MSYSIVIYGDNQRGSNDYYYIYIPYSDRSIMRVAWPTQIQPSFHPPMKFISKEVAEEFIEQRLNKSYTYKIVDTEEVLVNIAERKLRYVQY